MKLIIKICRTDLFTFLESYNHELFWSAFGSTVLPTKASAIFGTVPILDWWLSSASFLSKEYTEEATDFASKADFVHILEWWRLSGLPLRYTEAALEQATSKGRIAVLDWWRKASLHNSGWYVVEADMDDEDQSHYTGSGVTVAPKGYIVHKYAHNPHIDQSQPIRLKVESL